MQVRALELRPQRFSSEIAGHLNVDGETLDNIAPVRVEIVPSAWRVFRFGRV